MPDDPVARVLEAYPLIHHACRQRRVRLAGRAVSAHQATILAQLGRDTELTLGQLAQRMGVSLATMSLLVERLVRAGLIRRERDPRDGRRLRLTLTSTGARIRLAQSLLDPERVRQLLGLLTPAERAVGADGLDTLARAAQALGGAPRASPSPKAPA